VGAGPGTQVLLGLDRAGWQVSPQEQVPAGLPLHFLPPYAPALPPAERLWPLTNEALTKYRLSAVLRRDHDWGR
jgi:hypothetical protein